MQSTYDEFDKGFFMQEESGDMDEGAMSDDSDTEDDDADEPAEEDGEM